MWSDPVQLAGGGTEQGQPAHSWARYERPLPRNGSPSLSVVLEGKAREGAKPGLAGGVTVRHAVASGDDMLVDIAGRASGQEVTLVTADRELRRRAEALGADVVGPHWLFERLES